MKFDAAVVTIAGMAQANFWEMTGPMRQFDAMLNVERPDPRLRPGSTVRVILAGQRVDNVLQLPLQAVRQKDGKPIVYVQTGSGFEPRDGQGRATGPRAASGIEGIDEGTVIALVDPQAAARSSRKAGLVESDGRHQVSAATALTTTAAPRNARRGLDILPELEQGFDNLRAHKLRSLLTMLGMIFGVSAVIAMLSIGAGAQQQVIAFIEQLGVRNVIVEAREAGDSQALQRVRKMSAGLSFQDFRSIQANRRRHRGDDGAQANGADQAAAEAAGRDADALRRLDGRTSASRTCRSRAAGSSPTPKSTPAPRRRCARTGSRRRPLRRHRPGRSVRQGQPAVVPRRSASPDRSSARRAISPACRPRIRTT